MHGFRKNQPLREGASAPDGLHPLPSQLNDAVLVEVLAGFLKETEPTALAQILVALESLPGYYAVFQKTMGDSGEYALSMDGMIAFFLDVYHSRQDSPMPDRPENRRWWFLYVAALLSVAQSRAAENPGLWESIADLWALLMPGSRALRAALDQDVLWMPTDVDAFAEVDTEDDGQGIVECRLLPSAIRQHPKLQAFRGRERGEKAVGQIAGTPKPGRRDE